MSDMKLIMEGWRKFLSEDELVGALQTALSEDNQKIFSSLPKDVQIEIAKKWADVGYDQVQVLEAITLDIEVGDIVLGGKYKNKRIEVKKIGVDDIGQPTINGKSLLKFRIEKQLPDSKKSKKTKSRRRRRRRG